MGFHAMKRLAAGIVGVPDLVSPPLLFGARKIVDLRITSVFYVENITSKRLCGTTYFFGGGGEGLSVRLFIFP